MEPTAACRNRAKVPIAPSPPPRRRVHRYFPSQVLNAIFEFLWAVDLGPAACVNRAWNMAAERDQLWLRLLRFYRCSSDASNRCQKSSHVAAARSSVGAKEMIKAAVLATAAIRDRERTQCTDAVASSTPGDSTKAHGGTSKARFSDSIAKRSTFVPEAVAAVEAARGAGTAARGAFSDRLLPPLQRATLWHPPVRTVDEELEEMEQRMYATAPTVTDAAKVQLVEEQMAMLRRRIEAAGEGAGACEMRLAALTSLSRPVSTQLAAQISYATDLGQELAAVRLRERRAHEFVQRRAFVAAFEALVVRSIVSKSAGGGVVRGSSVGRGASDCSCVAPPPMVATFAQLESYTLTSPVFGSSVYMRWALMKRTIPVDDSYFDAIDAILDSPFSCDGESADKECAWEGEAASGMWWFLPTLGWGGSVVVSLMKAVLLLQGERGCGPMCPTGFLSFDDVLAAASAASGAD